MTAALLAASLVVAYGQTTATPPSASTTAAPSSDYELKDGESKCSCEPGWNGECTHGDDGKKYQVCAYAHECAESDNKTFSFCIPKGNIVCYRYQYLGTDGKIVDAQSHHPSKSCCDSNACSSRQTCVEMISGSDPFFYDYDDNGEAGGMAMQIFSPEEVARNLWKDKKDKDFQNKPKKCIDRVFDTTQITKQYVAPAVSMVVILIAIVFVLNKPSEKFKLLPLFVLGLSFFLTLSEGWTFALFTALVAVFTFLTSTAHQGKLVLFLLAYVWIYFGGSTLFASQYSLAIPKNLFLYSSFSSLTELETTCNTYFLNYFSLLDDAAWDTDETYTTYGLCGRWWIGVLVIIAYFHACGLLLMVAVNVFSFLDPFWSESLPQKMSKLGLRGPTRSTAVVDKVPEEALPEEA
jgi:uncharacterized membrane protein